MMATRNWRNLCNVDVNEMNFNKSKNLTLSKFLTMRNWYCFLAALLFSSTVYSQKPGDAEIQKAKEGYGKGDLQGWLNEAEKAES